MNSVPNPLCCLLHKDKICTVSVSLSIILHLIHSDSTVLNEGQKSDQVADYFVLLHCLCGSLCHSGCFTCPVFFVYFFGDLFFFFFFLDFYAPAISKLGLSIWLFYFFF